MNKSELRWMREAISVAKQAGNDCPIGAVIVSENKIVCSSHNKVESQNSPLGHAEMICISRACELLATKYLDKCVLYCTLEPCPMCMHAAYLAKIDRIVFGAFRDEAKDASCSCVGGILAGECAGLLTDFFTRQRE